ncbi:AraC family transcriptional regulator [Thalassospira sp. HF15]|uniref:cupin domain-containing protein n=1 Tax=Thalassospira sp. HF15 TaxID=2722755 RepID=UPI001430607A|nr:AraC family transcriptional regulator [Thalassospira sp. HF15]NIY75213.1 AraC family transcriptional regulator [Thalassospira sp. HF15]
MSEEARNSSEKDVLSDLFAGNHPRGDVIFAGTHCGSSHHQGSTDLPAQQQGMLHVLQRGSMRVLFDGREQILLDRPGIVLFGSPLPHDIDTPERGSEVVCANLDFPDTGLSPAKLGLPEYLVLPFDEIPGLEAITGQLFSESQMTQPGQRTAINLLVDLLLLMVLRHCQAQNLVRPGILAAMRDPRIARVVGELHQKPGENWSVERQAETAGMSRASFAARFRDLLGTSPGDFLQTIRLDLAFGLLREGKRLQAVASQVGYRSTTALARAIQQRHKVSPRELHADSSGENSLLQTVV